MRNQHRILLLLTVLGSALLTLPSPGEALDYSPFATRNQGPLVKIFGLPAAADAEVLPRQRARLTVMANIANDHEETGFEEGVPDRQGEAALLDGESQVLQLGVRYGVTDRFQVGLDLPYVAHNGGIFDGFIEGFHDFFALPQGGRDEDPSDQLLYLYTREGQEELRFTDDTSGLGDIGLSAAWQLLRREPGGAGSALSLHGQLKLPTGDSDRLLGSGGTDVALWLAADRGFPVPWDWGRLGLYGAGGLLYLSPGDVLPELQKSWAGFGSLGLGWATPWEWLLLKVQLDGHTSLYHSELREIGGNSLQLTLGGSVGGPSTTLDLGLTEDVIVSASPDAVFHLALRHRF